MYGERIPMTDFIIQTSWQCESLEKHTNNIGGYSQTGLFDERHYTECTCPAYKYGKREIVFGGNKYPIPCKHIREAEKSICGWQALFSEEAMKQEGVCPRCGERAVPAQIAV